MKRQLERLLQEKHIDLYFSDEIWPTRKRDGWVGVADVACSRTIGAVAVPRRRRGSYHVSEVLHEVAHLERWRALGISPTNDSDLDVCELAIEIANQYGFERSVLDWLRRELEREKHESQK